MSDIKNIKQKSVQYLNELDVIGGELDTVLSNLDNLSADEIKTRLKKSIGDIALWSFHYENMIKHCVDYIEKSQDNDNL